jgi:hypothetical protein
MDIIDPQDHERKVADLRARFGFRQDLAERVVELHERRLRAEARNYNAWLMNKLIVRLSGAREPRLAAFSVALALRVWVFMRRSLLKTTRQTAEYLGVDEHLLAEEVRRSTDWMEMRRD